MKRLLPVLIIALSFGGCTMFDQSQETASPQPSKDQEPGQTSKAATGDQAEETGSELEITPGMIMKDRSSPGRHNKDRDENKEE